MAFISILDSLPPDNVPVKCRITFYPGIDVVSTFDSLNLVFNITASGLIVDAQFVVEWELI